MKYRKKPVIIEAHELTVETAAGLSKWCGGRVREESKASDYTDVAVFLDIPTLEGVMTANVGDFIIKGVQGEFYPCKSDIFWETYERAS